MIFTSFVVTHVNILANHKIVKIFILSFFIDYILLLKVKSITPYGGDEPADHCQLNTQLVLPSEIGV